jgi:hypothetical protein
MRRKTARTRMLWWRKRVQRLRRKERQQKADKRATHAQVQVTREARRRAEAALARVRAEIKAAETPLRVRALREAERLIGVMEQGGNNVGPVVTELIRENGGAGPEPWCGDFVAHCYRKAGSKMVTRSWAAVRLLGWLTGMRVLSEPVPGCIVIYTFSRKHRSRALVRRYVLPTR